MYSSLGAVYVCVWGDPGLFLGEANTCTCMYIVCIHIYICTCTCIYIIIYIHMFIVFCVGGSKALPVLYSSYRTHNVWTGAVTSYSV